MGFYLTGSTDQQTAQHCPDVWWVRGDGAAEATGMGIR